MIKWRLRQAMAERGIWTAQELTELLEKKAGIILSHSAVAALMREPALSRKSWKFKVAALKPRLV